MMRPDDPRFTAYVVDEAGEETRAAVEEALEESPELRRESEELRAAARLLSEALASEEAPALSLEQRRRIERAARPDASRGLRRPASLLWAGLAAAAVAAAAVLWPTAAPERPSTAERPTPSLREAAPDTTPPQPAPQATALAPASASSPAAPRPTKPATASVQGRIQDSSGGMIPGVEVTMVEQNTGVRHAVTSSPSGEFALSGLPVGSYALTAEATGFRSVTSTPFELHLGENERVDVKLEVGDQSETIMVVSNSPPVGEVVAGRIVSVLPLHGRNFAQLSLLTPGGVDADRVAADGSDEAFREASAPFNREAYAHRPENDYVAVAQHPLSTFSVDVDTASYSNVRRFLNEGQRPPAGAVRIEEIVNYFPYDYAPPKGKEPFAAHLEMAPAPWNPKHRLLRIGLKARQITTRPASNLVFLLDVSGSMEQPNKLPLVKESLALLVDQLTARDRVAIVVYAGAAGLVLPPTAGDEKGAVHAALERLEAGGSTNGGEGIRLAYDLASRNFIEGGVNRVILATDGDFNVGVTDEGSLVRLIEDKAKTGVFLSVFGFGMGNYQDDRLEALADKGNGNYGYIDTIGEARKALVEQAHSTLVTVAKDVKIQVEFNPAKVQSYRLLGYENRLLRPEDFKDDRKDAGEVGAGHAVTALYELVPAGADPAGGQADPLTYQTGPRLTAAARSGELARLKLRYKDPEGDTSRPLEWKVPDAVTPLRAASADFKLAAAVAGFGMLLQDSAHKGDLTLDDVLGLGTEGLGPDRFGYRAEFLELVRGAKEILAERDEAGKVTRPDR